MTLFSVTRLLLVGAALAALAGCSRHVVVDPQTVASRNDPDWTVHAAPVTTAVVAPTAALLPPPPR